MTKKILFVDDDPTILRSYKRYLGLEFNIETALGGESGLKMLRERGPYAVIVSDMRMPGMNGTQFLSQVRERWPDSVRILLTGQADMKDAIAVVNEGQIFRFLTKPCPPETFTKALKDGIKQYQLITAEKELLEKTLKGSVKLLVDMVSLISPDLFSRSVRLRNLANKIATRLHIKSLWQIDVAALLSQIGCSTIPVEILRKKWQGQTLNKNENEMFLKHLKAGRDLLANIPRLEEIAEAIFYQEKQFNGAGPPEDKLKGDKIPLIARILKVVLDYDTLVMSGKSSFQAVEEMYLQSYCYDPDILTALKADILKTEEGFVIREINPKDVQTGMVLAEDVRTKTKLLLIPKRHEISAALRMCILNFAEKDNLTEPLKILDWIEKS
ncbi:MAG: HD domain-containing phosphohydrolase [bacterium]